MKHRSLCWKKLFPRPHKRPFFAHTWFSYFIYIRIVLNIHFVLLCFPEPAENENNAPAATTETENTATTETENTAKEETVERENVDNLTDDKNESSEFVNSQGVTFKPTAETVDDSGCVHK